jgi:hypothetical protein
VIPTLPKFSAVSTLLKYGMRPKVNIKRYLKEIGGGCAFDPSEFDIHMSYFLMHLVLIILVLKSIIALKLFR